MNDIAEKVEVHWEHDWKQFVIIPVAEKPTYIPSGFSQPLSNAVPLFCARCFRCNKYYTQELLYKAEAFGGTEGQLNLPQFGCIGPE